MKIVAIGDIHGKPVWKQAFEQYKDADKYIFLGDYVDGYTHDNEEIYQNLQDIIHLRKHLDKQVILLIGNHDLQYFYYPSYRCSGFRPEGQPALTALFHEHKELFQVAYQHNQYLFTHAGICKKWYTSKFWILEKAGLEIDNGNLANVLNFINATKYRNYLHTVGELRGGFGDDAGGITWADIRETLPDPLPGMHQIVGHSRVKEIKTAMLESYPPNTSITYIDCLESTTDFLYIEI